MKTKFIKVSRILLIIFAALVAVLIGYAMFSKQQEISLPPALGIMLLIAGFLTTICIVVAWVLDLIDNYKRGGVPYLISYVAVIAMLGLVLTGFDYFIAEENIQFAALLGKAAMCVCGIRAGSYIFRK